MIWCHVGPGIWATDIEGRMFRIQQVAKCCYELRGPYGVTKNALTLRGAQQMAESWDEDSVSS